MRFLSKLERARRQLLRELDLDLLASVVRARKTHRKFPDIERARHCHLPATERDVTINLVARRHQQLSHHGARSGACGSVEDGEIIRIGAEYVTYRRRRLDDGH